MIAYKFGNSAYFPTYKELGRFGSGYYLLLPWIADLASLKYYSIFALLKSVHDVCWVYLLENRGDMFC
jgi:hypothetical protein